ncbi:MAG: hypothetical protein A2822_02895 [Candidatus Staskawiczbacteria bacterium RIFCSPHIGHO2_01_FULL_41_41]|uniref:Uncharacterized protein n=1 Tax=Candidatus Staskawiczbacteria bacterium RIFCSPHIGHO2_01_FULL_41_41 TaxID=1802203 RepID=A0A1G2HX02_9BACT|nr:MAG: hypothetical protein A2822_02895 [Candidatus Staskawiczbacteria bacterium RIFCSPHIGHO2_01_FULL_41_41]
MPKSRLLQSLLDKFAKKDELCKLLFNRLFCFNFCNMAIQNIMSSRINPPIRIASLKQRFNDWRPYAENRGDYKIENYINVVTLYNICS